MKLGKWNYNVLTFNQDRCSYTIMSDPNSRQIFTQMIKSDQRFQTYWIFFSFSWESLWRLWWKTSSYTYQVPLHRHAKLVNCFNKALGLIHLNFLFCVGAKRCQQLCKGKCENLMFIYVWALCHQFCCFVKEYSRNKKGVKVNNK